MGKATGTAGGNLVGVRGSFTQFSVGLVSVLSIRKAPIAGRSKQPAFPSADDEPYESRNRTLPLEHDPPSVRVRRPEPVHLVYDPFEAWLRSRRHGFQLVRRHGFLFLFRKQPRIPVGRCLDTGLSHQFLDPHTVGTVTN